MRRDQDRPPELPLIPLLDPEMGAGDQIALETWHEALADAIGVEIPHDLFALWLYPADGGSLLVGPAALAEDRLSIPLPAPHVRQDQLFQLEEIVRTAGYQSAVCLPVSFGGTDVGLMLLADLRSGRYGARQGMVLQEVARRLGPTLARIARRRQVEPEGAPEADVVSLVGAALAEARTPRELSRALFAALARIVPHDRAELLVPGGSADQWYRFGEHAAGALWSDPGLVVSRDDVDVSALFDDAGVMLADDTRRDPRWSGWPDGLRGMRSAVGVRLMMGGKVAGALALGSAGAGLYGPADVDRLARIAPLIGPRIENFMAGWQLQVLRAHLSSLRNVPAHLARVSEILATIPDLGEATRRAVAEATAVVPADRIRFVLRHDLPDRVVQLEPGETRPIGELPVVGVGGTVLAEILDGELPGSVAVRDPESEMIVPLRVGGRITGAMIFTTTGGVPYARAELVQAQQVADAMAPHLELRRLAAAVHPPEHPPARTGFAPPAAPGRRPV
jgi:GAF domain-containing protein